MITKATSVSRLLGQAFGRSQTNNTRIKGWTKTHAGFVASQFGNAVTVAYEPGDWDNSRGDERRAKMAAKLTEYATTLIAAGYIIATETDYLGAPILVVAKQEVVAA
jgi:hypothetical protein